MQLTPFELDTARLRLAGLKNEGHSGEPVIALHGWLDNAASFVPLAEQLGLDRPFYALELPGHGHSQHRPESCQYGLIDNIVDLEAAVQALVGNDKTVTLVGHSLGGIICSLYAASRPERVSKLVLLDSLGPLTDATESVLPQLRKAMQRVSRFRPSRLVVYPDLEKAARVRMSGIGRIGLDAARLLVERGTTAVEGGYSWTSDPRLMEPSLLRFSEEQVQALFQGIGCPVCLICGDTGYFSDYASLERRLSYIKNIEKHLVKGGHHFHMEGDIESAASICEDFINT